MSNIARQVAATATLDVNSSIILTAQGAAYVAKRFAASHWAIEAADFVEGDSYVPTKTVEVYETFGYGMKPYIAALDGMEIANTHSIEAALSAAWVEVAA